MAEIQILSKIVSFDVEENLQIDSTVNYAGWSSLSTATVVVGGVGKLVILALNTNADIPEFGIFVVTLGETPSMTSPLILTGYTVYPASFEKSVSVENEYVTFLCTYVNPRSIDRTKYQPVTLTVKVNSDNYEVGDPVFLDKTDYNSTLLNKISFIGNSDYFIFENVSPAPNSQEQVDTLPSNTSKYRFGQRTLTQVFFQEPDWKTAFGIFNTSAKSESKVSITISDVYIPTDDFTFIPGKVYYSDGTSLSLNNNDFNTEITETVDVNNLYNTTHTVSNYLRIGTAIATDKLLMNIGVEKSETISVSDVGGGIIVSPF